MLFKSFTNQKWIVRIFYVYRGSRGDFFDRWALYFRWKLAYFFLIGGFGCSTDKKTAKKKFISNSDNGFLLIGVCLIYVWNIVAKLAKLKNFFFLREHPISISQELINTIYYCTIA